jgi:hypothetical protein
MEQRDGLILFRGRFQSWHPRPPAGPNVLGAEPYNSSTDRQGLIRVDASGAVKTIIAAGEFRPVASMSAADHLSGNIQVSDEALRDGPVATCWSRATVTRRAAADLNAAHPSALIQGPHCVLRNHVSSVTAFLAVNATQPKVDS